MNKRTIVSVLAFCLCCGALWAQTPNSGDDFDIIQNAQGGITITGYRGTSRNVVIPQTIEGIRVTEISYGAFKNKSLLSVVIPNTVITIGAIAFGYDYNDPPSHGEENNIGNLVIPNSVRTIGSGAFERCGIKTLTLGNSVVEIGDRAFNGNQIAEVQFPSSLRVIGFETFGRNEITSITIPSYITKCNGDSFELNPITTVILQAPASLYGNGIRNFLRGNKSTITSITLPANVNTNWLKNDFGEGFSNYYETQGRKAGTYTFSGRIWTVR